MSLTNCSLFVQALGGR